MSFPRKRESIWIPVFTGMTKCKTMTANLIEIFQSIQGEGKYAGVKQIFVRFFECNMHCVWCDTPHSIGDTTRQYREVDLENVVKRMKELLVGTHSVSLTGGEPLLQAGFIKKLIPEIKKMNLPVYLETNGILPNELKKVVSDIDMVAMDFKLPSSTKCRSYWEEHEEFLNLAKEKDVFIKTVITTDTGKNDVLQAADMVAQVDPNILFILQPNTFDLNNGAVQKCLEFQNDCMKRLTNVRVLPQMHKFLKVR